MSRALLSWPHGTLVVILPGFGSGGALVLDTAVSSECLTSKRQCVLSMSCHLPTTFGAWVKLWLVS